MNRSLDNHEIFFPALAGGSKTLTIDIAGVTEPDPAYRIRRRESAGHVLEYVTSGRGHVCVDGEYFAPEAGDVYYLQPGSTQDYYSDRKEPWRKLWINFRGPLADALCDVYHLRGKYFFPQTPLETEFLELHALRKLHDAAAIQEAIALGLHRILRKLAIREATVPSPERRLAERMAAFLTTRLNHPFSLTELSNFAGTSPIRTERIFRREMGLSPRSFFQEQRFFRACQYLENTTRTVKEIAEQLGFADEFYFSNWFRERAHQPPGRYRRRLSFESEN